MPGQSDEGMVMDFGDIKRHLMRVHDIFDHCLTLYTGDALAQMMDASAVMQELIDDVGWRYTSDVFGTVQLVSVIPTAENLARICYDLLSFWINRGDVRVKNVMFWETPTSVACYPSC